MAAKAVLDASALVALVHQERGHETVRRITEAGVAVTTPTGLAEALNTSRRKGYQGTREELSDDLAELGLKIEPLIKEDAIEMAFLLARSAELGGAEGEHAPRIGSLSLGDAACLAVARRLGIPAVCSDGTWELLDVRGLRVMPFR